ncbi:MAG: DUF1573 domain-containing protein [Phycisphaerae bacterium]|nr:DUF1573 domain-containing protein [Phycisphaerae bacterium]
MNRFLLDTCSAVSRSALALLVALACLAVAGLSPAAEPEKDAPRFEVSEMNKDFGEFWAGLDLAHSFTVKNTGTATLEILKVKASCGCTSTGYDKQIAPGKEGKINVKVRTKNFRGKFSKSVTISTNDPNNPTVRLKLSGVAKQYITVEPHNVSFTKVQPDQVLNKTITIVNNSDEHLELTVKENKVGPFSAELKEIEPGKHFELAITGNPPYRPRLNRATFYLGTNIAAQKEIKIRCTAMVPPRLELRPESLQFRSAQDKESKRTVRFINNGKTEVKITAVEVNDPRVTATVHEQQPGKDYVIEVIFPAGYLPQGQDAELVINTDDAQTPRMIVPITKFKARKAKPRPGEKLVGHPAPRVTIETVDGKQIAVGEPGDEVLVLEFYACWCGFSKRSLPEVETIHQKYKGKGVRVIAISEDTRTGKRGRTEQQIAEHFKELGLTMERVLDPDHKAGGPYFAESFPIMYLLGKNGVVEAVHFGAKRNLAELVSGELDRLLAGESLSDSRTGNSDAPGARPRRTSPTILPIKPLDVQRAQKARSAAETKDSNQ